MAPINPNPPCFPGKVASWYREGLAQVEGLSCIEQRPLASGSLWLPAQGVDAAFSGLGLGVEGLGVRIYGLGLRVEGSRGCKF